MGTTPSDTRGRGGDQAVSVVERWVGEEETETAWSWMRRAPCKDMGEIFYPESDVQMRRNGVNISDDSNSLKFRYTSARAKCASCEFQPTCLQTAIDEREDHGIWGGYSPRDRQKIRRGRRPGHPLQGTCRGCGWRQCRCDPEIQSLRLSRPDLVASLLDG